MLQLSMLSGAVEELLPQLKVEKAVSVPVFLPQRSMRHKQTATDEPSVYHA